MKYTLKIQLSASEGAIVRALGMIERRGFNLDQCAVSEVDDCVRTMQVTVTSTRPGDLLKRQLERLHDVLSVELKPGTESNTRNPAIRPIDNSLTSLT